MKKRLIFQNCGVSVDRYGAGSGKISGLDKCGVSECKKSFKGGWHQFVAGSMYKRNQASFFFVIDYSSRTGKKNYTNKIIC